MKKISAWLVVLLLAVGAGLWWMRRPPPPQPAPPIEEAEATETDPLWPATGSQETPAFQQEPVRETEVVTEEPPSETPTSTVKMGEERWAGGALKAHGPLKQRADGQWVKDGIWTNYWANGRINTFGQYEADEPVGTWPFWMDQGQALLPNQYRPPTLAQNPASLPSPVPVAAASGDRAATPHPTLSHKGRGNNAELPPIDSRNNVAQPPPAVTHQGLPTPTRMPPPTTKPPVPLQAAEQSAQPSSGCVSTRLDSLDWNAAAVAKTLEVLFPELLFQYDAKIGMLKSTGCDKQLKLIVPLLAVARSGSADLWRIEVEKQLWNAGSQLGLLRHSIYGFDLKKPSGSWTLAGVTPDAGWAQRLGGKAIYGVTVVQKKTRMTFLVADLKGARAAREIGEKDAKLAPGAWPQAVPDARWKHAVAREEPAPLGGILAKEKTNYRARALYDTGSGKMVAERFYLAQPSAAADSTRLYFFLTLIPEADYFNQSRWPENFVAGLTMPEAPTQPVVAQSGGLAQALAKAGGSSTPDNKTGSNVPARAPAYEWRLHRNPSAEVRQALVLSHSGKPKEAEGAWNNLLPKLSQADRPEILWHLARSQMEQGKYETALATFARMEKESSGHPLVYQAAIQQGIVLGHYLHQWNQAEAAWQRAVKATKDPDQKRQAAYQLAKVPYYKKQYRQAVQALEKLLENYPTDETADFVRPYIWYLKNCVEKKI